MSQFEENGRRKSNHGSAKKSLGVDLTPMVDLGFLLITFFILTTALSEPTIARLIMPKDSNIKTPVKKNAVLTLLLMRNDSIAWYEGDMPKHELIKHCPFNELRSVIQQKKQKVAKVLGNRNETVVIISPGNESTYKNFVDALDEIQINDIQHYFVVDAK
jgi:biopolymer transport protein ExbD